MQIGNRKQPILIMSSYLLASTTTEKTKLSRCSYASINVKPEGGGGDPGIGGAFGFPEEFLVKIPTIGPHNLVKSDQLSLTFQRLIF